MDHKCFSCCYKTKDTEELNQHEIIEHDVVRCKFCVNHVTTFNVKCFFVTLMGSNVFDSHCSELHKNYSIEDVSDEYSVIIRRIQREDKRRIETVRSDEDKKFLETWENYASKCYRYYDQNRSKFEEEKITIEKIKTRSSAGELINFIANVHRIYNKELLLFRPVFPGCKKDCTWRYNDDRCKCGEKKFEFRTDEIKWDLWYTDIQKFSLDHHRPIGTLIML